MSEDVKYDEKQFAMDAARIALESKCKDVTVVDLRGKSPATDFFVIGTCTSGRQARSIADEIEVFAKEKGTLRFGKAGYEQGRWVLVDFVNVVVHLFDEEYRDYYDLELLWGDAETINVK